MQRLRTILISIACGFILGLLLMGYLRRPVPPKVIHDEYHPQVNLPDGSVVVEEKPTDVKPEKIKIVTKTVEVIRTVTVTVKPDPPECPPMKVTLKLVKQEDQTLRAVVSAEGGKILESLDIPSTSQPIIITNPPKKELKWAAGAVYGTTAWGDTAKGAFVDRDFSIIRAGAELTKNTYANVNRQGWEGRIKVGIRW